MKPWELFSLFCILLFVKGFIVAGIQGYYRITTKIFVRPDDAAFFGKTEPATQEHPVVDRAQSALRNDLENIPFFLFLLIGYIQQGCWPQGIAIYGGIFVFSRVVHTAAYIRPTQPLRNRAYILGLLMSFLLCIHLGLSLFSK
ncbi:MAG: MAPEG family protein [Myxococcales bacterium]|nr:MAPEG family protein [Myxococcales bacterium]